VRRDVVLRIIAENREELARFGVKSLAIYGSVARDEAGTESHVDLLVEFSKPVGLFGFVELKEYLERILGRPVDLGTPRSLREEIREEVLRESVRAA
jgi:predicted nucleotidyltransferase